MLTPRLRAVRALRAALLVAITVAFAALPALAGFSEDFEQPLFDEGPDFYVKDHTLVREPDGLFHLFYIVGHAGENWPAPGNEVDFGHASSPDLIHWTVHPRVIPIDPAHHWKSRNVWAPTVIALAGAPTQGARAGFPAGVDHLMAYTGVDSAMNQAIGFASAAGPFPWNDLSIVAPGCIPNPIWARWNSSGTWSCFRDPYLRVEGGEFLFLATAQTRPGYLGMPSRGAIALARSIDGLHFVDAGAPLVINNSSSLMESPHLAHNPENGLWHLFYTRTSDPAGVSYLTSVSPTSDWDAGGSMRIDSIGFASEISGDDESIYSSVIPMRTMDDRVRRAVRFDSLAWAGGAPRLVRRDPFRARWQDVEGSFPALPTYQDRPAQRGAPPSNMEGRFWINTAEAYAGPYGGESAAVGALESLVGVLRSGAFTISGETMELWVGGTASPTTYVALVDAETGEPLRQETGSGNDVMSRREWDVSDLKGQRAVIEIVDHNPAGHVSVDAIREQGGVLGVGGVPRREDGLRIVAVPNPAPGGTTFRVSRAGAPAAARLFIYDVRGRLVRRLGRRTGGADELGLAWDGRRDDGRPAGAGVYVARVEAAGVSGASSIRVVLLR